MSLTVGGVVANLGARLDDAAFDRWEKRLTQARHAATDDVEAKLGGDYEDRDFRRYEDRLDKTRRDARDDVVTKLRGDDDETGFRRWTSRLTKARRDAHEPVNARLGADVDHKAFDRYNRSLDDTDDRTNRFRSSTMASFGAIRLGVGGAAVAASAGVGILGKTVIGTATDINESLSKNVVLFGKYADGVDKFAQTSAKAFGISRQAALEATGTFGNLFVALDIAPEKSAAMSVSLTELAADLASFNNASPEDALEAIRSGLVGETEPLRRFGVNLADAQLRTEALSMGLVKNTKEALTPQTKALAVNALLFKQTEKAQGDFARTSDGLANRQRILKARLSDTGAEIGAKLLPAATKAVGGFNSLLDVFADGSKPGGPISRFGKTAKGAFEDVRGVVRTVFAFVGRVIDDNRDTLDTMGRSLRGLASTADRALDGIRAAFASVFSSRSGTGRDVRAFIRAILDIADAALKVFDAIAKRALPGIVTAFRGFFQVLRGVIRLITGVLTGDFGKAWDGVKDIFGGGVKAIAGLIRAGTAPIRAAAAAVGGAIAGAFSSAWKAITGTAEGFVNRVIDVINIIPGVNIKHVGGGKSKVTSDGNARAGAGRPGNFAQGGAFGMTGGFIDEPIAVMGEEAPTHPEWVIPENPAYRGRALELWAAAGEALGAFRKGGRLRARARAFAEGGVVSAFNRARQMTGAGPKPSLALFEAGIVESGLRNLPYGDRDSVGALQQRPSQGWTGLMDPFRAAIEFLQRAIPLANSVGSAGQLAQAVQRSAYPERYDAVRGQAEAFLKGGGGLLSKIGGAVGGLVSRVVETAAQVARRVVGKLPGNPGGILKGAYSWALGKAREFIRDKATDVLETVKGAIGLGRSGGKGVRGGTLELARRVAAAAGLRVGSSYRDPSHNAAVGGVPGSLHTHGSPSNPGAVDLNGPPGALYAGQAAASKLIPNLKENLVHDVGSGLHLHLGFFRRGGRALARLGGAFRTGGAFVKGPGGRKLKPRPAKPSKPASVNAGVRRSVARGEAGIAGFEDTIQDLERDYDQADRRFGLTEEVLLIENEDGSTTVDTAAVQQRLAELEGLRRRREAIKKKIEAYRRAVGRLIRTLTAAIGKLKKALRAAGGKSRAKERAGYREAIQTYTERIGELRGVHKDLGGDVEDQRIDLDELRNEYEAVKSTASTAADTDTDTASPDADTAPSYTDTSAAIDPAAQAAEIAAQARAQFEAFQSARADLFRDFGSNNVPVGMSPYATSTGLAAGAQYFGAASGGTVAPDARAFATAGGSVNYIENATFENHYPATPPDGGSHIQQQAREARLAFG